MGLTTKKQKIQETLPKPLDSFQIGPWRVVFEPQKPVSFNLGLNFAKERVNSWMDSIRTAPIQRYLLEVYQLGPIWFMFYVVSQVVIGLQPAFQLHYSNKLFSVLENVLVTGKPDKREILTAIGMRIFAVMLISTWHWVAENVRPVFVARLRAHFKRRSMEAQLRLDLLSAQTKSSTLDNDIHFVACDLLDGLLNILSTTASTVSQLAVVSQILRKREGGFILLFLSLAQPVFRSITVRTLWNMTAVYWINDEWQLRLSALYKIILNDDFRQEVISGGLGKYLTEEYKKAEVHYTGGTDDSPFMAYGRRQTPFYSMFMSIFDDLPLLYIAFSSLINPTKFSIASLAILTQTNAALRGAFYNLYSYNSSITESFTQLKRMYTALDLQSKFDVGSKPYPPEKSNALDGMEIELRDVTFHYPGTEEAEKPKAALRNVSFTLPSSSMVVIVGENGSGKTSLVKLLSGLYRPTSGDILIDGLDAREYKVTDLADSTALLTQEHAIFPLPISENIGMGDVDCVFDLGRIKEAAEMGGASKFIEKLDYAYEEVLQPVSTANATKWPLDNEQLQKLWDEVERVKDLSGGEKQRLAAARTFMRLASGRIKLLVVDEPTSAMDPSGEYDLFERLRAMRPGKTVVFVTHRFGHLTKHADMVLCMKEGVLVEAGTHRELIEKKGEYQRLYDIQARAFVDT